MEGRKGTYQLISENEADLYGETDITDLILELAANNCKVTAFHEHDESLENFYMNLVGGEKR